MLDRGDVEDRDSDATVASCVVKCPLDGDRVCDTGDSFSDVFCQVSMLMNLLMMSGGINYENSSVSIKFNCFFILGLC